VKLDYKVLLADGVIQLDANNSIQTLEGIMIDDIATKCTYQGQVNSTTKRPSGLGMAVDTQGCVYEGFYTDGALHFPRIQIQPNGSEYAICSNAEGHKYCARFN